VCSSDLTSSSVDAMSDRSKHTTEVILERFIRVYLSVWAYWGFQVDLRRRT
jgi:hypothetical protein